MKLVSRMSGLASLMRSRSSVFSCPVYRAKVGRRFSGKPDWSRSFVEFFGLAVGQSIHWVDHDCSRALLFALGARTDGRIDEPTFDALSPGVHVRDAIAILPVTIAPEGPDYCFRHNALQM